MSERKKLVLSIDEAMIVLREQFAEKRGGQRVTLGKIRSSLVEYCRARDSTKPQT
ncbi:MAG: hypothetical protein ABH950_01325 [Candidatus Altiarchaeota archaeon]